MCFSIREIDEEQKILFLNMKVANFIHTQVIDMQIGIIVPLLWPQTQ